MIADRTLPFHRIGLYDAYLATLGGGENFLAVFAELLEHELPEAEIEIITHEGNHVAIEVLAERFGVSLRRTRLRRIQPSSRRHLTPLQPVRRFFHERDISNLSSEYDLFLNNTIFSVASPASPYSIYMCMFPLTPVPWAVRERALRRWLFTPYIELRRRLYHRWVGRYDLLLANSEFTRGWIRRLWNLESEVLFPPIETQTQLRLGSKSRKILAIGRFFPGSHNKKHDILIQAFRRLRRSGLGNWELHLVGGKTPVDGTDAYLDRLRALARGQPVFFHLDAPKTHLVDLLRSSSFFWHATGFGEQPDQEPEKLEHFGMSTVEAMTHGCVPLVFRCGGQPEIIQQGINGFLWETLDELQEHTLRLAKDRKLREAVAQAAHERSQSFSRDAFRARAQDLLSKLVSLRRKAEPEPSA